MKYILISIIIIAILYGAVGLIDKTIDYWERRKNEQTNKNM